MKFIREHSTVLTVILIGSLLVLAFQLYSSSDLSAKSVTTQTQIESVKAPNYGTAGTLGYEYTAPAERMSLAEALSLIQQGKMTCDDLVTDDRVVWSPNDPDPCQPGLCDWHWACQPAQ